jgi:phosphoglycolate phosphatase
MLAALKDSKNIIWDWNGTLLNDLEICIKSINTLLDQRGIKPLTQERYLDIFTFPVKDYYVEAGFDFSKEPFEVVAIDFMNHYSKVIHECPLHESTEEVLFNFKESGYRQIILSAMEQGQLNTLVNRLKLDNYFEAVYGIDNQLGAGKKEIASQALKNSKFSAYETCIIGDSLHDAEVAHYLNVNCILVAHGHQSAARLRKSGYEVVMNLEELIN